MFPLSTSVCLEVLGPDVMILGFGFFFFNVEF